MSWYKNGSTHEGKTMKRLTFTRLVLWILIGILIVTLL